MSYCKKWREGEEKVRDGKEDYKKKFLPFPQCYTVRFIIYKDYLADVTKNQ